MRFKPIQTQHVKEGLTALHQQADPPRHAIYRRIPVSGSMSFETRGRICLERLRGFGVNMGKLADTDDADIAGQKTGARRRTGPMVHETASFEPAGPSEAEGSLALMSREPTPVALPMLALSVVLIAAGSLAFCCLLAVFALLILYAQVGADGVSDFYQELRFDIPLKTQIGAALISALYAGVAITTVGAAALRGRHGWAALLALTKVRGGPRPSVGIFLVTLAYAATATLAMTLLQDHRVVVSGPTDLALLATITANLVVLAPCAEELFFRGWLYTALRCRLAFWPSYLLTASLFAAIHWDANHRRVFLVLPLALALGLLREITGSIKPTIALHATYNLIIVAITLFET